MAFSNDDFDEDVDDILLSDDESTKKPKRNSIVLTKESDIPKEKPSDNRNAVVDKVISASNNTKNTYQSKLFDDDHDPLATIDTPKQPIKRYQEPSSKSARSVIDSLLNPVSELDDFSFGKKDLKVKDNKESSNDKTPTISDDFRTSSNYQASNKVPQIKASKDNVGSKRTVRFSMEADVDDGMVRPDSVLNRPVTAPSSSTEPAKSKFISRFEEAEFTDIIPKHSSGKFSSESDPTLWTANASDDFLSSSGSGIKLKVKEDDIETKKSDSNFRTNAKQKLNEFLQTSNEDISSLPANKINKPSVEDLNFPAKPMKSDEPFNSRKSSSQGEHMFERSRSGSVISEGLNLEGTRRSSVLLDSSFERPRTSYGRSDGMAESQFGSRHGHDSDTLFDRPQTAHGRYENPQNRSVVSRNDLSDIDLQLKQVQSERDDLKYKLESVGKRNKEEMEILEKSYKNRIELMEDNIRRKEQRFMEEIEMLTHQNKQKLQMLEDERMEMRSELSRRQDDMDNQKRNEIMRLKEQQKLELDKLRNNHEDLIGKLNYAKSEEDSTIRSAQPTTIQLQSVLAQVSNGAQDLASLKQQLLDQINCQMKEKDTELKLKNESLRQLEEQLHGQKDENFKERERLQSLISKLDIQLKEQAKQAEEERWYLRQEQNKLAALQSSLDKEREHLLIEKDKNRASLEDFRTKLLEEQKQLFDKVFEEKRSLAEERAKLTREVSKWSESNQFSSVKKTQESAELEGIRSALAEERRDLELLRCQLAKEREENIQKLSQINSLTYDLKLKSEKLNQLEREIQLKQGLIDEKEKICRQHEMTAKEALEKSNNIQNANQDQLSTIQKQLIVLTEKEKQIHKDQMELEARRSSFVKQDKSSHCQKCSNILRDSAIGGSLTNVNTMSVQRLPPKAPVHRRYDSDLDPDITNSIEYSNIFAAKLEEERLISSIRRAADEDRDYLENERSYLRSLASNKDQYLRNQVRS